MKKKLFRRITALLIIVMFFAFNGNAYAARHVGLGKSIASKIYIRNTRNAVTDSITGTPSDTSTQQDQITNLSSSQQSPADDSQPATTETPAATETPIATEMPAATEAPVASEAPAEPEAEPAEESDVQNPDSDGWYTIDNAAYGISSNGQNARTTTDGINAALNWASNNGYNKVRLSDGTYMIQCKWQNRYIAPTDGILVPSNMTFDLGNAVLKIEPNSYVCYSIISVVDQSNVTITGGTLIGDRSTHTYSYSADSGTHEWGFGVVVSASTNVVVSGITIRETTGDGVILTGSYRPISSGGRICSNVSVLNCDISSCRRQGISVIGATDSVLAGNTIYNINGTDPQYGIDVEPEADYSVDNLKIYGNTISGCTGGAINCNKGSNYEVYNNTCIGNKIIAVRCTNVSIYNNTITNSQIRVMDYSSNVTVTDNSLDSSSWIFFG